MKNMILENRKIQLNNQKILIQRMKREDVQDCIAALSAEAKIIKKQLELAFVETNFFKTSLLLMNWKRNLMTSKRRLRLKDIWSLQISNFHRLIIMIYCIFNFSKYMSTDIISIMLIMTL